jgi:predicted nucleotidyltransferase
MLRRSVPLTEEEYIETKEIAEEHDWSLGKTLRKLVKVGIQEEKENNVLKRNNK